MHPRRLEKNANIGFNHETLSAPNDQLGRSPARFGDETVKHEQNNGSNHGCDEARRIAFPIPAESAANEMRDE